MVFSAARSITTGSAPVGGFWYTREGLEAPDIQIHFASGATLYNNEGKIEPLKIPAMSAVVNQVAQNQRFDSYSHCGGKRRARNTRKLSERRSGSPDDYQRRSFASRHFLS